MNAKHLRCLLMFLCVLTVLHSAVSGQTPEEVKRRVLASLQKIDNYPAAIVKGKMSVGNALRGNAHLHFRGKSMWMEIDRLPMADEETRRRLEATYEVMGTTDFPHTVEFDGKQFFEFSPYNLALSIQDVKSQPWIFADCPLLPEYWLHMGGNDRETFKKFCQDSKYEVKVEKLSDGEWKLSQSNLGSLLPGGNARVAIRDRYIIVDEKCNYLVTQYWGTGFQGTLVGTMTWEPKDGNWYAKKGIQTHSDHPVAEWEIDEIEFDASKCRQKFNELESIVPFATKILREDEKQNELSTKYKGGRDGETEFKLRELAWLKRKKEGF